MTDAPRPSTACVHAGDARDAHGAMTAPLYKHTTFAFDDTAALIDAMDGRSGAALYTRYGRNPTIEAVEAKLAALEGAQTALAFGSGMAAISGLILGLCRTGDHVVCVGDVYGGTWELLARLLPDLGVETTFVDDPAEVGAAARPTTRLVYAESPSNPRLDVIDLAALAASCVAIGAPLVVDNTFATPINQRPLALGATFVIHSATKFLGGHSDLTAGAVIGSADALAPIRLWRRALGSVIAPEVAHLLARSLRTLDVRVQAHNARAAEIARRLEPHPAVAAVRYPGLASHAGHAIARRQMRGFGGMITFEYRGDAAATTAMVERLRLFANAPSLGGVESLVTQPLATTHHGLTADERARRGIVDGMVRLSIGLEDVEDLWEDLVRALDK